MLKKLVILLIASASLLLAQNKPTLLFYCGITMVKPMTEISKIIEERHNCTVKISQGGSQDLYDALKFSKIGDLYLPGSDKYLKENAKDGFFGEGKYVGFNKAAIFVQKGNPKKIKNLDDLLNTSLLITLCNPNSGSIGKNTKSVLTKYKGKEFFEEVYDNVAEIGTDSRNLNAAIIKRNSDMAINWRATGFWPENAPYIDVIEIDDNYAPKKKLILTPLTFSKHPEIVKAFIDLAASKEGQEIMKKYGFL